jgi:hypothetical protein
LFFLARCAMPTSMVPRLEQSLREADRLYYDTFDIHGFGLHGLSTTDTHLAVNLVMYVLTTPFSPEIFNLEYQAPR